MRQRGAVLSTEDGRASESDGEIEHGLVARGRERMRWKRIEGQKKRKKERVMM